MEATAALLSGELAGMLLGFVPFCDYVTDLIYVGKVVGYNQDDLCDIGVPEGYITALLITAFMGVGLDFASAWSFCRGSRVKRRLDAMEKDSDADPEEGPIVNQLAFLAGLHIPRVLVVG